MFVMFAARTYNIFSRDDWIYVVIFLIELYSILYAHLLLPSITINDRDGDF